MSVDKINSNNKILPDSAAESKDKRDPRMLEAAKGFENQFIRQMITEMRKTVPKDELVGDSMADDIFRDQLDDQYADLWVKQGGIGLADMIYDQLYEKYGPQVSQAPLTHPKSLPSKLTANSLEKSPISSTQSVGSLEKNGAPTKPRDILSEADKKLFLLKMQPNGLALKSKEPLPEKVSLRSPLAGVVLQAAALEDGRQMVVVRHDQGLVTRFVHTGDNRVKNDMKVAAGEVIAELPASKNGEFANVVFELRQTPKPE